MTNAAPLQTRVADPRTRLADALTTFAAAQVLLPISIVTVAVAGFAAGRPMTRWVLPTGVLLALLALRVWSGSWRALRSTAALVLCTAVAAAAFAIAVPDYSWDGLAYQQEAVIRLASGWNPLAGSSAPYGPPGEEIWIDHYPEAPWIAEAAVFLDIGRVEAGKLFNLTLMVAAGAIVTAALLHLTTLELPAAAMLGLLAGLNPVAISQGSTFMVDSVMASALTVLVAALVLFTARAGPQSLSLALLAACLAINTKFTGVLYVVALLGLTLAFIAWRHGLRAGSRAGLAAAATLVVSLGGLGYAPYVNNVRDHGNPFYPVTPRGDVMNQQARIPVNLRDHNRVVRFLQANFAQSEELSGSDSTHFKPPFVIRPAERRAIYVADLEAGGFGPLYSAMLVMAAIGGMALIAMGSARRASAGVLFIAGAVLVSIFTHDQSWVARYAPQAWLLPLLIAVPYLGAARWSSRWWLGGSVAALALLNLAVVGGGVGWRQWTYARTMHRSLTEMANAPQPIIVYFERFRSLRQRLHEAGIEFQPTEDAPGTTATHHEIPAPGHRAFWIESHQP